MSTYNKIPDNPHFAAIEFSSVHIEGDERSRQAPGHGYPAHDVTTLSYRAFENETEMQQWVEKQEEQKRRHGFGPNYRIIFVQPATIAVTTKVQVSRP